MKNTYKSFKITLENTFLYIAHMLTLPSAVQGDGDVGKGGDGALGELGQPVQGGRAQQRDHHPQEARPALPRAEGGGGHVHLCQAGAAFVRGQSWGLRFLR